MAEIDPNTPQVVDPERTVDLTRLLQIRGPLGVLNVLDTIVPVVNMGDVVARTVRVDQPVFSSSTIFSAGILTAVAINTVHADTGAQPEGDYDILLMGWAQASVAQNWTIEHRNAANTANLAQWSVTTGDNAVGQPPIFVQKFAYSLSINERLRILNVGGAFPAGNTSHAVIFARRRI